MTAFQRRVLISLSFLQPCSVAKVWKTMSKDLQGDAIRRDDVYRAMYALKKDGLITHPKSANYLVSAKGLRLIKGFIGGPKLF